MLLGQLNPPKRDRPDKHNRRLENLTIDAVRPTPNAEPLTLTLNLTLTLTLTLTVTPTLPLNPISET